jgi:molecular chaperone DnaK (HSP70)
MEDGDLKISDINEIVLVGGSTRIPKVQQLVKDYFNGKVCSHCILSLCILSLTLGKLGIRKY